MNENSSNQSSPVESNDVRLRFDGFLLEPTQGRLSSVEEEVPLQPKSFDVLCYLVERAGQLVTKEELLDALWPDTHVTENALARCIAEIRRALGDDARNPRFVQNVPRRGYRFIAEVSLVEEVAQSEPDEERALGSQSPFGRWVPLAAVLAALLLFSLWWLARPPESVAELPFADPSLHRPISSFPGSHVDPAVSPDGTQIAFVDESRGRQLWTVSVDGSNPVQRTSSPHPVSRPKWLPSGQQLLYTRWEDAEPALWTLGWNTGEDAHSLLVANARDGSWSADGSHIVFQRGDSLWLANADGSEQRRIDGLPQRDFALSARQPALSPDAQQVVYFENDGGPMGDLWLLATAGGTPRRLTRDTAIAGDPVFTPDGKHVVYSSRRTGVADLLAVALDDGAITFITRGRGSDSSPSFAQDGKSLVYASQDRTFTLMLTDLETGEETVVFERDREIVDPEISPSGEEIVFFGFDDFGDVQIQVATLGDSGGSSPRRVSRTEGEENIHPRWSSDGGSIYAYRARPEPVFRRIDRVSGESTDLVAGWTWGAENEADVDSEGRFAIYTRLDQGRPAATMLRDLETGSERSLPVALRTPTLSPDDRSVAGVKLPEGVILICRFDEGDCREVAAGDRPQWSADGAQLFFTRRGAERAYRDLWTVEVSGENARRLVALGPLHPIGPFFSVAHGKAVWVRYEQPTSELWVMQFP